MPLYLVDAAPVGQAGWEDAVRLAARRFPEVGLEHRYADHRQPDREVWLCRAPSEQQILQWAEAAALPLLDVRHVDAVSVEPRIATTSPTNGQEHP